MARVNVNLTWTVAGTKKDGAVRKAVPTGKAVNEFKSKKNDLSLSSEMTGNFYGVQKGEGFWIEPECHYDVIIGIIEDLSTRFDGVLFRAYIDGGDDASEPPELWLAFNGNIKWLKGKTTFPGEEEWIKETVR